MVENLRSERILNGIDHLESLNASLSQSLWSLANNGRLNSIYSSNDSLLNKRASSGSIEHTAISKTTSADDSNSMRIRPHSKSGSFDCSGMHLQNDLQLARTTSVGWLGERPQSMPDTSMCLNLDPQNILGGAHFPLLPHTSLSQQGEDSIFHSMNRRTVSDPIAQPLTGAKPFRPDHRSPFSDDSGTDGSDTAPDDTLTEIATVPFEGNSSENNVLGEKKTKHLSVYYQKKLSNPSEYTPEPEDPTNYLEASTSYHSRTDRLSPSNSPHPLKSILSRTPSPKMPTDKNTSPTNTPQKANPRSEDRRVPIRPKFCSVGSLDIPDPSQILPPSDCSGFLTPYHSNNFYTLPHRRPVTRKPSKLTKSRSLSFSESCLLNGCPAGSHFDVIYIKDNNYSGSQKPNVATVKEEEEAVSSDLKNLMDDLDDEDTAKEKYVMRLSDSASEDTDTLPPKPVTKNKVMFSEMAEVCSFVSLDDDSSSEVDSQPSTPDALQLIPGWSPKKKPSVTSKPQVDKISSGDSDADDTKIKADAEKVNSEVGKIDSPTETEKPSDLQVTTIDLTTPTTAHDDTIIDSNTSAGSNMNNSNATSSSPSSPSSPVIKEPTTNLLVSSINIHQNTNTSPPVKQLSADQSLRNLTDTNATTNDTSALTMVTQPCVDQPFPVLATDTTSKETRHTLMQSSRRMTKFQQRQRKESKLKRPSIRKSGKTVRELSRMFESPERDQEDGISPPVHSKPPVPLPKSKRASPARCKAFVPSPKFTDSSNNSSTESSQSEKLTSPIHSKANSSPKLHITRPSSSNLRAGIASPVEDNISSSPTRSKACDPKPYKFRIKPSHNSHEDNTSHCNLPSPKTRVLATQSPSSIDEASVSNKSLSPVHPKPATRPPSPIKHSITIPSSPVHSKVPLPSPKLASPHSHHNASANSKSSSPVHFKVPLLSPKLKSSSSHHGASISNRSSSPLFSQVPASPNQKSPRSHHGASVKSRSPSPVHFKVPLSSTKPASPSSHHGTKIPSSPVHSKASKPSPRLTSPSNNNHSNSVTPVEKKIRPKSSSVGANVHAPLKRIATTTKKENPTTKVTPTSATKKTSSPTQRKKDSKIPTPNSSPRVNDHRKAHPPTNSATTPTDRGRSPTLKPPRDRIRSAGSPSAASSNTFMLARRGSIAIPARSTMVRALSEGKDPAQTSPCSNASPATKRRLASTRRDGLSLAGTKLHTPAKQNGWREPTMPRLLTSGDALGVNSNCNNV